MNIVIAGGSGGIGSAFVEKLAGRANVETIIATYHRGNPPEVEHPAVSWQQLDLTNEAAIPGWAAQVGEIDWLINTASVLHKPAKGPEKTIRHIDPDFFMENMSINALPSLLLAKHLHARFRHGRPAVFATVSAKVGSIEDNPYGANIRTSRMILLSTILRINGTKLSE